MDFPCGSCHEGLPFHWANVVGTELEVRRNDGSWVLAKLEVKNIQEDGDVYECNGKDGKTYSIREDELKDKTRIQGKYEDEYDNGVLIFKTRRRLYSPDTFRPFHSLAEEVPRASECKSPYFICTG